MASDSLYSRRISTFRWPSFRHIAAALTASLLLFVGQAPAASDDDTADSQRKRLNVEGYTGIETDFDARKVEIEEATISYGSMKMTADLFVIYWKESTAGVSSINPEDIERCIVKDNIKIVFEHSVVTGKELVYDSAEQTLVITGEPAILESKGSFIYSPVFKFTSFTPDTVQTMFARPQDATNTL